MLICDVFSVLHIDRLFGTSVSNKSTRMNRPVCSIINRRQFVEPLIRQLAWGGKAQGWTTSPVHAPRFGSSNRASRSSRLRSVASSEHQATEPVVGKRKVALFVGYEVR
jgi:hypothetical protein